MSTDTPTSEPARIEIEELREAGEDGGDLMGYFARGHHAPEDFAAAANRYSGAYASEDLRHVRPGRVRHVWYRTVQMAGEPKGTYEYRPGQPGTPGSWKATVCESVSDYQGKISRARIREYDRGYQEGLDRALGFLLAQLEWGKWDDCVSKTFRRSIAAELREAFKRDHPEMEKQKAS